MTIITRICSLFNFSNEAKLYKQLNKKKYREYPYEVKDLGEGMVLLNESIGGWWKPRYLIDEQAQCAYELMDGTCRLLTVTDEDIEWSTLRWLPEKAVERAKEHSGYFPTHVYEFENDTAKVDWQINPDGMYYMDSDGYGMSDDEEITLSGKIDRTGKVVEKFRYPQDEEWVAHRLELERITKEALLTNMLLLPIWEEKRQAWLFNIPLSESEDDSSAQADGALEIREYIYLKMYITFPLLPEEHACDYDELAIAFNDDFHQIRIYKSEGNTKLAYVKIDSDELNRSEDKVAYLASVIQDSIMELRLFYHSVMEANAYLLNVDESPRDFPCLYGPPPEEYKWMREDEELQFDDSLTQD